MSVPQKEFAIVVGRNSGLVLAAREQINGEYALVISSYDVHDAYQRWHIAPNGCLAVSQVCRQECQSWVARQRLMYLFGNIVCLQEWYRLMAASLGRKERERRSKTQAAFEKQQASVAKAATEYSERIGVCSVFAGDALVSLRNPKLSDDTPLITQYLHCYLVACIRYRSMQEYFNLGTGRMRAHTTFAKWIQEKDPVLCRFLRLTPPLLVLRVSDEWTDEVRCENGNALRRIRIEESARFLRKVSSTVELLRSMRHTPLSACPTNESKGKATGELKPDVLKAGFEMTLKPSECVTDEQREWIDGSGRSLLPALHKNIQSQIGTSKPEANATGAHRCGDCLSNLRLLHSYRVCCDATRGTVHRHPRRGAPAKRKKPSKSSKKDKVTQEAPVERESRICSNPFASGDGESGIEDVGASTNPFDKYVNAESRVEEEESTISFRMCSGTDLVEGKPSSEELMVVETMDSDDVNSAVFRCDDVHEHSHVGFYWPMDPRKEPCTCKKPAKTNLYGEEEPSWVGDLDWVIDCPRHNVLPPPNLDLSYYSIADTVVAGTLAERSLGVRQSIKENENSEEKNPFSMGKKKSYSVIQREKRVNALFVSPHAHYTGKTPGLDEEKTKIESKMATERRMTQLVAPMHDAQFCTCPKSTAEEQKPQQTSRMDRAKSFVRGVGGKARSLFGKLTGRSSEDTGSSETAISEESKDNKECPTCGKPKMSDAPLGIIVEEVETVPSVSIHEKWRHAGAHMLSDSFSNLVGSSNSSLASAIEVEEQEPDFMKHPFRQYCQIHKYYCEYANLESKDADKEMEVGTSADLNDGSECAVGTKPVCLCTQVMSRWCMCCMLSAAHHVSLQTSAEISPLGISDFPLLSKTAEQQPLTWSCVSIGAMSWFQLHPLMEISQQFASHSSDTLMPHPTLHAEKHPNPRSGKLKLTASYFDLPTQEGRISVSEPNMRGWRFEFLSPLVSSHNMSAESGVTGASMWVFRPEDSAVIMGDSVCLDENPQFGGVYRMQNIDSDLIAPCIGVSLAAKVPVKLHEAFAMDDDEKSDAKKETVPFGCIGYLCAWELIPPNPDYVALGCAYSFEALDMPLVSNSTVPADMLDIPSSPQPAPEKSFRVVVSLGISSKGKAAIRLNVVPNDVPQPDAVADARSLNKSASRALSEREKFRKFLHKNIDGVFDTDALKDGQCMCVHRSVLEDGVRIRSDTSNSQEVKTETAGRYAEETLLLANDSHAVFHTEIQPKIFQQGCKVAQEYAYDEIVALKSYSLLTLSDMNVRLARVSRRTTHRTQVRDSLRHLICELDNPRNLERCDACPNTGDSLTRGAIGETFVSVTIPSDHVDWNQLARSLARNQVRILGDAGKHNRIIFPDRVSALQPHSPEPRVLREDMVAVQGSAVSQLLLPPRERNDDDGQVLDVLTVSSKNHDVCVVGCLLPAALAASESSVGMGADLKMAEGDDEEAAAESYFSDRALFVYRVQPPKGFVSLGDVCARSDAALQEKLRRIHATCIEQNGCRDECSSCGLSCGHKRCENPLPVDFLRERAVVDQTAYAHNEIGMPAWSSDSFTSAIALTDDEEDDDGSAVPTERDLIRKGSEDSVVSVRPGNVSSIEESSTALEIQDIDGYLRAKDREREAYENEMMEQAGGDSSSDSEVSRSQVELTRQSSHLKLSKGNSHERVNSFAVAIDADGVEAPIAFELVHVSSARLSTPCVSVDISGQNRTSTSVDAFASGDGTRTPIGLMHVFRIHAKVMYQRERVFCAHCLAQEHGKESGCAIKSAGCLQKSMVQVSGALEPCSVYFWKPIPRNPKTHCAMGLVCTTTRSPPPVSSVAVVQKGMVLRVQQHVESKQGEEAAVFTYHQNSESCETTVFSPEMSLSASVIFAPDPVFDSFEPIVKKNGMDSVDDTHVDRSCDASMVGLFPCTSVRVRTQLCKEAAVYEDRFVLSGPEVRSVSQRCGTFATERWFAGQEPLREQWRYLGMNSLQGCHSSGFKTSATAPRELARVGNVYKSLQSLDMRGAKLHSSLPSPTNKKKQPLPNLWRSLGVSAPRDTAAGRTKGQRRSAKSWSTVLLQMPKKLASGLSTSARRLFLGSKRNNMENARRTWNLSSLHVCQNRMDKEWDAYCENESSAPQDALDVRGYLHCATNFACVRDYSWTLYTRATSLPGLFDVSVNEKPRCLRHGAPSIPENRRGFVAVSQATAAVEHRNSARPSSPNVSLVHASAEKLTGYAMVSARLQHSANIVAKRLREQFTEHKGLLRLYNADGKLYHSFDTQWILFPKFLALAPWKAFDKDVERTMNMFPSLRDPEMKRHCDDVLRLRKSNDDGEGSSDDRSIFGRRKAKFRDVLIQPDDLPSSFINNLSEVRNLKVLTEFKAPRVPSSPYRVIEFEQLDHHEALCMVAFDKTGGNVTTMGTKKEEKIRSASRDAAQAYWTDMMSIFRGSLKRKSMRGSRVSKRVSDVSRTEPPWSNHETGKELAGTPPPPPDWSMSPTTFGLYPYLAYAFMCFFGKECIPGYRDHADRPAVSTEIAPVSTDLRDTVDHAVLASLDYNYSGFPVIVLEDLPTSKNQHVLLSKMNRNDRVHCPRFPAEGKTLYREYHSDVSQLHKLIVHMKRAGIVLSDHHAAKLRTSGFSSGESVDPVSALGLAMDHYSCLCRCCKVDSLNVVQRVGSVSRGNPLASSHLNECPFLLLVGLHTCIHTMQKQLMLASRILALPPSEYAWYTIRLRVVVITSIDRLCFRIFETLNSACLKERKLLEFIKHSTDSTEVRWAGGLTARYLLTSWGKCYKALHELYTSISLLTRDTFVRLRNSANKVFKANINNIDSASLQLLRSTAAMLDVMSNLPHKQQVRIPMGRFFSYGSRLQSRNDYVESRKPSMAMIHPAVHAISHVIGQFLSKSCVRWLSKNQHISIEGMTRYHADRLTNFVSMPISTPLFIRYVVAPFEDNCREPNVALSSLLATDSSLSRDDGRSDSHARVFLALLSAVHWPLPLPGPGYDRAVGILSPFSTVQGSKLLSNRNEDINVEISGPGDGKLRTHASILLRCSMFHGTIGSVIVKEPESYDGMLRVGAGEAKSQKPKTASSLPRAILLKGHLSGMPSHLIPRINFNAGRPPMYSNPEPRSITSFGPHSLLRTFWEDYCPFDAFEHYVRLSQNYDEMPRERGGGAGPLLSRRTPLSQTSSHVQLTAKLGWPSENTPLDDKYRRSFREMLRKLNAFIRNLDASLEGRWFQQLDAPSGDLPVPLPSAAQTSEEPLRWWVTNATSPASPPLHPLKSLNAVLPSDWLVFERCKWAYALTLLAFCRNHFSVPVAGSCTGSVAFGQRSQRLSINQAPHPQPSSSGTVADLWQRITGWHCSHVLGRFVQFHAINCRSVPFFKRLLEKHLIPTYDSVCIQPKDHSEELSRHLKKVQALEILRFTTRSSSSSQCRSTPLLCATFLKWEKALKSTRTCRGHKLAIRDHLMLPSHISVSRSIAGSPSIQGVLKKRSGNWKIEVRSSVGRKGRLDVLNSPVSPFADYYVISDASLGSWMISRSSRISVALMKLVRLWEHRGEISEEAAWGSSAPASSTTNTQSIEDTNENSYETGEFKLEESLSAPQVLQEMSQALHSNAITRKNLMNGRIPLSVVMIPQRIVEDPKRLEHLKKASNSKQTGSSSWWSRTFGSNKVESKSARARRMSEQNGRCESKEDLTHSIKSSSSCVGVTVQRVSSSMNSLSVVDTNGFFLFRKVAFPVQKLITVAQSKTNDSKQSTRMSTMVRGSVPYSLNDGLCPFHVRCYINSIVDAMHSKLGAAERPKDAQTSEDQKRISEVKSLSRFGSRHDISSVLVGYLGSYAYEGAHRWDNYLTDDDMKEARVAAILNHPAPIPMRSLFEYSHLYGIMVRKEAGFQQTFVKSCEWARQSGLFSQVKGSVGILNHFNSFQNVGSDSNSYEMATTMGWWRERELPAAKPGVNLCPKPRGYEKLLTGWLRSIYPVLLLRQYSKWQTRLRFMLWEIQSALVLYARIMVIQLIHSNVDYLTQFLYPLQNVLHDNDNCVIDWMKNSREMILMWQKAAASVRATLAAKSSEEKNESESSNRTDAAIIPSLFSWPHWACFIEYRNHYAATMMRVHATFQYNIVRALSGFFGPFLMDVRRYVRSVYNNGVLDSEKSPRSLGIPPESAQLYFYLVQAMLSESILSLRRMMTGRCAGMQMQGGTVMDFEVEKFLGLPPSAIDKNKFFPPASEIFRFADRSETTEYCNSRAYTTVAASVSSALAVGYHVHQHDTCVHRSRKHGKKHGKYASSFASRMPGRTSDDEDESSPMCCSGPKSRDPSADFLRMFLKSETSQSTDDTEDSSPICYRPIGKYCPCSDIAELGPAAYNAQYSPNNAVSGPPKRSSVSARGRRSGIDPLLPSDAGRPWNDLWSGNHDAGAPISGNDAECKCENFLSSADTKQGIHSIGSILYPSLAVEQKSSVGVPLSNVELSGRLTNSLYTKACWSIASMLKAFLQQDPPRTRRRLPGLREILGSSTDLADHCGDLCEGNPGLIQCVFHECVYLGALAHNTDETFASLWQTGFGVNDSKENVLSVLADKFQLPHSCVSMFNSSIRAVTTEIAVKQSSAALYRNLRSWVKPSRGVATSDADALLSNIVSHEVFGISEDGKATTSSASCRLVNLLVSKLSDAVQYSSSILDTRTKNSKICVGALRSFEIVGSPVFQQDAGIKEEENTISQGLTEDDVSDLLAFYSSSPPPTEQPAGDDEQQPAAPESPTEDSPAEQHGTNLLAPPEEHLGVSAAFVYSYLNYYIRARLFKRLISEIAESEESDHGYCTCAVELDPSWWNADRGFMKNVSSLCLFARDQSGSGSEPTGFLQLVYKFCTTFGVDWSSCVDAGCASSQCIWKRRLSSETKASSAPAYTRSSCRELRSWSTGLLSRFSKVFSSLETKVAEYGSELSGHLLLPPAPPVSSHAGLLLRCSVRIPLARANDAEKYLYPIASVLQYSSAYEASAIMLDTYSALCKTWVHMFSRGFSSTKDLIFDSQSLRAIIDNSLDVIRTPEEGMVSSGEKVLTKQAGMDALLEISTLLYTSHAFWKAQRDQLPASHAISAADFVQQTTGLSVGTNREVSRFQCSCASASPIVSGTSGTRSRALSQGTSTNTTINPLRSWDASFIDALVPQLGHLDAHHTLSDQAGWNALCPRPSSLPQICYSIGVMLEPDASESKGSPVSELKLPAAANNKPLGDLGSTFGDGEVAKFTRTPAKATPVKKSFIGSVFTSLKKKLKKASKSKSSDGSGDEKSTRSRSDSSVSASVATGSLRDASGIYLGLLSSVSQHAHHASCCSRSETNGAEIAKYCESVRDIDESYEAILHPSQAELTLRLLRYDADRIRLYGTSDDEYEAPVFSFLKTLGATFASISSVVLDREFNHDRVGVKPTVTSVRNVCNLFISEAVLESTLAAAMRDAVPSEVVSQVLGLATGTLEGSAAVDPVVAPPPVSEKKGGFSAEIRAQGAVGVSLIRQQSSISHELHHSMYSESIANTALQGGIRLSHKHSSREHGLMTPSGESNLSVSCAHGMVEYAGDGCVHCQRAANTQRGLSTAPSWAIPQWMLVPLPEQEKLLGNALQYLSAARTVCDVNGTANPALTRFEQRLKRGMRASRTESSKRIEAVRQLAEAIEKLPTPQDRT